MVNQYTHIGHWSYMVNQYTHIVHWSVSSPIRTEPARYVTEDFQNKGANNTTAASNGERSTENRISLTSPKLYLHRGWYLTVAAYTCQGTVRLGYRGGGGVGVFSFGTLKLERKSTCWGASDAADFTCILEEQCRRSTPCMHQRPAHVNFNKKTNKSECLVKIFRRTRV
jgi:hypothetical protein